MINMSSGFLWSESAATAVYINNRLPYSTLPKHQTPQVQKTIHQILLGVCWKQGVAGRDILHACCLHTFFPLLHVSRRAR